MASFVWIKFMVERWHERWCVLVHPAYQSFIALSTQCYRARIAATSLRHRSATAPIPRSVGSHNHTQFVPHLRYIVILLEHLYTIYTKMLTMLLFVLKTSLKVIFNINSHTDAQTDRVSAWIEWQAKVLRQDIHLTDVTQTLVQRIYGWNLNSNTLH